MFSTNFQAQKPSFINESCIKLDTHQPHLFPTIKT
jgi:hypothetical protein